MGTVDVQVTGVACLPCPPRKHTYWPRKVQGTAGPASSSSLPVLRPPVVCAPCRSLPLSLICCRAPVQPSRCPITPSSPMHILAGLGWCCLLLPTMAVHVFHLGLAFHISDVGYWACCGQHRRSLVCSHPDRLRKTQWANPSLSSPRTKGDVLCCWGL